MGCYLILVAKERVLSGAIELAALQPRLGFGDGPLFGRPKLRDDEKPNRSDGLPALTGPDSELVYAASWFMGNSFPGTAISGAGGR